MTNFKIFLIILWGLFFLFIIYQIYSYIKYLKWLKNLENKQLPRNIINILQKLPHYNKLNETQKKILHFKIQRFIKEKEFIGVKIDITDEIKYTIAFYACLITLNKKYFCYENLKYIYIYPHTIIVNNKSIQNYIVKNETFLISGEAVGESVIIAWDEVKKELKHLKEHNVIIHEFAHELDFEEGEINGIPPIEKNQFQEWSQIMYNEFEKFHQKTLKNRMLGKYSFIDKYAATNKAEFFAVMSEYYFNKPKILKKHFPDIYKELKKFYKIELCI